MGCLPWYLLAAEPLLVSISYDDLLFHGYLFGIPVSIFEEWKEFGSVGPAAYSLHGSGTLIAGLWMQPSPCVQSPMGRLEVGR